MPRLGTHGGQSALAMGAAMVLAPSVAAAQPQPPTPPGQDRPQIQPPRPGGPQIQPPRPGRPEIQPPRPDPGPRPPRPPQPPAPAPGPGLALFSGRGYAGASRTFLIGSPNLAHTGFNDRVRSVRVARGSRWLLCSDANFRGRCAT